MPRKSKDELKTNIVIEESATTKAKKASGTRANKRKLEETSSKVATTKSTTKKVTTRSKATSDKTTAKKNTVTKKSTDTQESAVAKKSIATKGSTTSKNSTSTQKSLNKKANTEKDAIEKDTAKKSTNKKSSSKTEKKTSAKTSTAGKTTKTTKTSKTSKTSKTAKATKSAKNSRTTKIAKASKSTKSSKAKSITSQVEYYDLPYRYNETVVKILAQTPTTLFIYWDIADIDREGFIQKYGNDFFEKTKPVLLVHNKTMHYQFEVEINDFANSWYLHVNDANCDYSVELGRRPYEVQSPVDSYVYVTTSNDMEMPNNRILFDRLGKSVFFKNIQNNFVEEKQISSLSFIKNLGKIYDIYELYKEMYKEEINLEELASNNIKLNLSSSNSSTFK